VVDVGPVRMGGGGHARIMRSHRRLGGNCAATTWPSQHARLLESRAETMVEHQPSTKASKDERAFVHARASVRLPVLSTRHSETIAPSEIRLGDCKHLRHSDRLPSWMSPVRVRFPPPSLQTEFASASASAAGVTYPTRARRVGQRVRAQRADPPATSLAVINHRLPQGATLDSAAGRRIRWYDRCSRCSPPPHGVGSRGNRTPQLCADLPTRETETLGNRCGQSRADVTLPGGTVSGADRRRAGAASRDRPRREPRLPPREKGIPSQRAATPDMRVSDDRWAGPQLEETPHQPGLLPIRSRQPSLERQSSGKVAPWRSAGIETDIDRIVYTRMFDVSRGRDCTLTAGAVSPLAPPSTRAAHPAGAAERLHLDLPSPLWHYGIVQLNIHVPRTARRSSASWRPEATASGRAKNQIVLDASGGIPPAPRQTCTAEARLRTWNLGAVGELRRVGPLRGRRRRQARAERRVILLDTNVLVYRGRRHGPQSMHRANTVVELAMSGRLDAVIVPPSLDGVLRSGDLCSARELTSVA